MPAREPYPTTLLNNNKSPLRDAGELDNRGSHFYLARYWSQQLATQTTDPALQQSFTPLAQALADQEQTILDEINKTQGHPTDLAGYYAPDDTKAEAAMRPSATFNKALSS